MCRNEIQFLVLRPLCGGVLNINPASVMFAGGRTKGTHQLGLHRYLNLTNSARGRSPRNKYNVPVSIFTTVTLSSFLTILPLIIFLLMVRSGNRTASHDPLVDRVPIRIDCTLALFALVALVFNVVVVLDSREKVSVFCTLQALSLPLFKLDSSLSR